MHILQGKNILRTCIKHLHLRDGKEELRSQGYVDKRGEAPGPDRKGPGACVQRRRLPSAAQPHAIPLRTPFHPTRPCRTGPGRQGAPASPLAPSRLGGGAGTAAWRPEGSSAGGTAWTRWDPLRPPDHAPHDRPCTGSRPQHPPRPFLDRASLRTLASPRPSDPSHAFPGHAPCPRTLPQETAS